MEGEGDAEFGELLRQVTDGEWAGWMTYAGLDPFEDAVGPFYWRREAGNARRCAFRAEPRHMNGGGFMHGGCMMSFADFALFEIARDAMAGERGVTASFSSEFVGAIAVGQLVECTGEVVKAGRSLVFVRGIVTADGEPALSFSGLIKKMGPRRT